MTSASVSAVAADQFAAAVAAPVDGELRLDLVAHDDWDRQVTDFTDVSYDQTTVFAAAKRERDRLVACRVMRGSECIGGAMVTRYSVPGLRTSLYFVKYGPLWRRTGAMQSWLNYAHVVRALRREFCDKRASLLTIVPRPNPEFAAQEAEILAAEGFRPDRYSPDPNRYLVDLKSPGDPLAGLSQKWRYNLRRSRKEGLTTVEHDPVDGFAAFAELHRAMVERKHFHSEDAVQVVPQLAEALPAEIAPQIFLTYDGERPVAGAVIGKIGDMACYLYGASSHEGTARNAGYCLQWHIVEELRQSSQRWYDLGGEALNPGLKQFKRGLVGKTGIVFETPGEFSCWGGTGAKLLGTAAYAARMARLTMRNMINRNK